MFFYDTGTCVETITRICKFVTKFRVQCYSRLHIILSPALNTSFVKGEVQSGSELFATNVNIVVSSVGYGKFILYPNHQRNEYSGYLFMSLTTNSDTVIFARLSKLEVYGRLSIGDH